MDTKKKHTSGPTIPHSQRRGRRLDIYLGEGAEDALMGLLERWGGTYKEAVERALVLAAEKEGL